MGWADFIQKIKVPNVTIIEGGNQEYDTQKVGTIEIPDKLTDTNALLLASTVAEIYFAIDYLADRASKVKPLLYKNGILDETTPFYKLLESNPLDTFSDLVYKATFNYLADGNCLIYQTVPSLYEKVNANNISKVDVLNPLLTSIKEYNYISRLDLTSLNDLIVKVEYTDIYKKLLDKNRLLVFNYDQNKRSDSNILSKSPLFHSFRSINNLLATYSARYNVYVNNGAAGYLSKKQSSSNTIEENLNPITREEILKDINNRNGITGSRHLWGVSSTPIEFVNTLADIQKLMPFDETLEDTIKIASTFQIPPELVPRKDQSTFNNKDVSERSVWENTLISLIDTIYSFFTKSFALDKEGYELKADYSSVSCLQDNIKQVEEIHTIKIANNKTLYQDGIITLNQYLIAIGQEEQVGGDKYVYDLTKTPYAAKYGAIIMESMMALITDVNLTPETKLNTLIVVFGLSDEEAKQIINTNGKN